MTWPAPIHTRLDELVEIVRDEAGRDTNRKELVAALIFAASTDPEQLDALVKAYRLATARDALISPTRVEDGNVLRLPAHKPGPR